MPLAVGTRLGPYEIVAPLGAGGMGEVYRAKDTRLDRSVAIKVLPSHLTADPERRARFEREAKAVSSLNHPHICTVYDVGHEQGTDYLVMELVEGETLAQRVKKGALPLDQLLRTAIEIADALDKAHRQGVIHRDLKPGNVMLTKAGSKLMDFGLAKRAISAESGEHLSALPTEAPPLTGEGRIVGTMAYMAPEQLEGKDADARSDLWAFGCVLYEMATGRRAFEGKSQASLISAIMTAEPQPITQLQPLTPPALERLVKVCLAKDPDDRLQTAHDVMQELKWIAEAPAGAGAAATGTVSGLLRSATPAQKRWALAALGLTLLVGGILGGLVEKRMSQRSVANRGERRATFVDIALPPGVQLYELNPSDACLSGDGRQLVFFGLDRDGGRLWLRDLDSGATRPLAGTEGAQTPVAWSRDNRRILYLASDSVSLKELEIPTGTVRTFAALPKDSSVSLGAWNESGDFLLGARGGLFHAPPSGGDPKLMAPADAERGETILDVPQFLPDGRHYLFSAFSVKPDQSGVYVGVLGSAERKLLLPSIPWAALAPQGYLVFRRESVLFAQRFDPHRLELSGEPQRVVDGVRVNTWGWPASWVAGDTLVYVSGTTPRSQFTWFDRAGRESRRVGEPAEFITFDLSPDGTRVVASVSYPGRLWVIDTSTGTSTVRTQGGADIDPRFSGDAQSVLFARRMPGQGGLFRMSLSGGSRDPVLREPAALSPGGHRLSLHDWSRDGRLALYTPGMQNNIRSIPVSGGQPQSVVEASAVVDEARFSPDARWVAYNSDENGRREVFVVPFPPTGERHQVSTTGGVQPLWRGDGRELFYLDPTGNLMSVEVTATRTFTNGPPRVLFPTGIANPSDVIEDYGVTADGQRFLLKLPAATNTPPQLKLILDWPALLGKSQ
jgi:eukaryotic-like serine/threonine-protein kinase